MLPTSASGKFIAVLVFVIVLIYGHVAYESFLQLQDLFSTSFPTATV